MNALLAVALLFAVAPPPDKEEWNQWRGANRDGISPDKGIVKKWPRSGPPLVWKATGFGEGFSNISFWGDHFFTMGVLDGKTKVIAAQAKDGKVVWTAEVGEPNASRNPGPRSTPATDGKYVWALGQQGELVCVTIDGKKEVWRKHLIKDYGGKKPGWDYASSPVLDGDLLVCKPGGNSGSVVALKKETGTIAWKSPGIAGGAEHTSLVPVEIGGVRQYLAFTREKVAGVSAADGKVLWEADRKGKVAICSDPLYSNGIVFVSSAYKLGHHAFKVDGRGGKFAAQEIYSGDQMQNHHGGMVLVGTYIFGLSDNGGLMCMDIRSGKVLWKSNKVRKGSIAYADGILVAREEGSSGKDGAKSDIVMVAASPKGYGEVGRFTQPERSKQPAWTHPTIYGGRMYIRDQDVLLCYQVGARRRR